MEALSPTFLYIYNINMYKRKEKNSGSVNRLSWHGDTGSGLCRADTQRLTVVGEEPPPLA